MTNPKARLRNIELWQLKKKSPDHEFLKWIVVVFSRTDTIIDEMDKTIQLFDSEDILKSLSKTSPLMKYFLMYWKYLLSCGSYHSIFMAQTLKIGWKVVIHIFGFACLCNILSGMSNIWWESWNYESNIWWWKVCKHENYEKTNSIEFLQSGWCNPDDEVNGFRSRTLSLAMAKTNTCFKRGESRDQSCDQSHQNPPRILCSLIRMLPERTKTMSYSANVRTTLFLNARYIRNFITSTRS